MTRKLRDEQGFPAEEAGTVIAETPKATSDAMRHAKKWLPLQLDADGNPDTDKLPPALTKEKIRIHKMIDGSEVAEKQLVYAKPGEARYSVTQKGEVVAWYRKRGGVGRRLVFQFKKNFKEDPTGRQRAARDKSFRNFLRRQGVPGA